MIDKTVTWHREFGKHQVSIVAIAKATLMDNAKLLAPGDIIGFASRRSNLDFFHTGLVAFGKGGELLLRHASQSHGRVVEEKMATFVTVNPVKYVTLLRAAEPRRWLRSDVEDFEGARAAREGGLAAAIAETIRSVVRHAVARFKGVLARCRSATLTAVGQVSRRRGLALRLHLGGVVVHQLLGDGAGREAPLRDLATPPSPPPRCR